MTEKIFKDRISKFGSLVSITALVLMSTLFFLGMPEFVAATPGRVMAIVWSMTAILALLSHSLRIKTKRPHYPVYMPSAMNAKPMFRRQKTERALSRG